MCLCYLQQLFFNHTGVDVSEKIWGGLVTKMINPSQKVVAVNSKHHLPGEVKEGAAGD